MSRTIGDLIATLTQHEKASDAAVKAATDASKAATDALAVVDSDRKVLAPALKAVGDIAVDNGDGTFTGYFADASPQGFHTELLKGASAPVPDDTSQAGAPELPPEVAPTEAPEVSAPVDAADPTAS